MVICRWVDSLGNLHGRFEGGNASSQALLIGSHLVTPFFFQFLLIFMIQHAILLSRNEWLVHADS